MLTQLVANVPVWIWGAFLTFVLGLLALDLGVFHRKAHKVEMKEALVWSAIWICLALLFNFGIFQFWHIVQPQSAYSNTEAGFAFLAGYLVEKALSVDNIFVFLLVFSYFKVPDQYQHRVLFWGIVGALVFRALFIAIGATILHKFVWTMVLFGLFLVFTGVKMALAHDKKIDPTKNPLINFVRRFVPVTDDYEGQKFFTVKNAKRYATPLFIVLLTVEFTDIIFAADSIPAIFAITSDPFLVFTSNVFAILGLRALFFAVAGLMQMFHYLSYGLAAILVFVGSKMIYGYTEQVIVPDWPKFNIGLSLGIIAAILAISIIASIIKAKKGNPPLQPQG